MLFLKVLSAQLAELEAQEVGTAEATGTPSFGESGASHNGVDTDEDLEVPTVDDGYSYQEP